MFRRTKISGVRGQMRIFSAAVERLKQCLDPEEEKKRQPFVQQLQEEPRSVTPPQWKLIGPDNDDVNGILVGSLFRSISMTSIEFSTWDR